MQRWTDIKHNTWFLNLVCLTAVPFINTQWTRIDPDRTIFIGAGFTLALFLSVGARLIPAILVYAFTSVYISINNEIIPMHPGWDLRPDRLETLLAILFVCTGEIWQIVLTQQILNRSKPTRELFLETRDVFLFVGIISVAYFVGSVIISIGWIYAHYNAWDNLWTGVWSWFLAELAGVIFVTPIILSWYGYQNRRLLNKPRFERIIASLITIAATVYFFSGWFTPLTVNRYPVFIIPLVIWLAYRYSFRQSIMMIGIICLGCFYGVVNHRDVDLFTGMDFIVDETFTRQLYTQCFIILCFAIGLLISVSRAENARIRGDLQRLNRRLEQRVKERNHELNHQLRTQSLINHVASAANATQNPDEALAVALKAICEFSHCHLGRAFLINKDNNGIHFVSTDIRFGEGHAELDNLESLTDTFTVHPNATLPAQVYQHRKPVLLQAGTSPEAEPAALDDSIDIGDSLYDKLSIRAAFGCPVLVGDEVCAVLEGYSRHDQLPSDLKVVLRQVGVVLGRVFERQAAVIEKQRLNQQLVQASRQAGMSEVASGVLHNVGNVLNSVNVANQTARDLITRSSLPGLEKTLSLIEQQTDLKAFLSQPIAANDEGGNTKAHSLLAYLDKLHDKLSHEHQLALHELDQLHTNIEHIKNIISRQQQYARPTQALEPVLVEQLVNDALLIHAQSFSRQDIEVIRQVDRLGECYLDRHQVLQIVGNLISNAGQAVAANTGSKQITLSVRSSAGFLYLSVEDNGCGIAPEHQAKIFRHGFTTKREGHGFGLHASANTAQEMGGSLSFSSAGKGQGTCFMLKLPYKPAGKQPLLTAV